MKYLIGSCYPFRGLLLLLCGVVCSVVVLHDSLATLVQADSAQYRLCETGTTACTIGEFLYDDDYTPITTATCTLTSRREDDTVFLNAVAMTSDTDGWYSYDVDTTGESDGLYRSQVCCTAGSDYLCLDKSFIIGADTSLSQSEIADAVWDASASAHNDSGSFGANLQNPPALSAADIWNYPDRTLSSFGSLIADIWAYSSRSLNSVTSLVSSIWSSSDRTLSSSELEDGGDLATQSDVEDVEDTVNNIETTVNDIESTVSDTTTSTTNTTNTTINSTTITSIDQKIDSVSTQVGETRNLLEVLVNRPIIETTLDAEEPFDLSTKLDQTETKTNQLYSTTQSLKTHLQTLITNWDSMSNRQVIDQVALISEDLGTTQVLGVSSATYDVSRSVNTQVSWLTNAWASNQISNLDTVSESALALGQKITRAIGTNGKNATSKEEFEALLAEVIELEAQIGNADSQTGDDNLYGHLKLMQQYANAFDQLYIDINDMIEIWEELPQADRQSEIDRLSNEVLSINLVPGAVGILESSNDSQYPINRALALRALTDTNRQVLAQLADKPSSNVWLENGSIIFKSLVTNPSAIITQDVPIKYYLPQEITRDDIISKDDFLTIEYDPERDALYVSGELQLEPQETKTFKVEVRDIWIITDEELDALRKQAETLFEPLKNTSYFAQGATLKADIDVSLDKISRLQKEAHTPESRIRAYRESVEELKGIQEKLDSLKTLAGEAGSVGTVFGFIGGVQTLAVWGLIIILIAGFVFLALYIKMISKSQSTTSGSSKTPQPEIEPQTQPSLIDHAATAAQSAAADTLSHFAAGSKAPSDKKGVNSHAKAAALSRSSKPKPKWAKAIIAARRHKVAAGIITALLGIIVILISVLTSTLSKTQSQTSGMQFVPGSPPPRTESEDSFLGQAVENKTIATDPDAAKRDPEQLSTDTTATSEAVLGAATEIDPTLISVVVPESSRAVNIRLEPENSAEILYRLWRNQQMTMVAVSGDWVAVELTGVEYQGKNQPLGWIHKTFIVETEEISADTTPATTTSTNSTQTGGSND